MPHNNRMKRVIFLDFDGVLNTGKYQNQLKINGEKRVDDFGPLFDPESVRNLKTILDAVPDALLVITSSWKDAYGPNMVRSLWKERGLPGKIHSMTRACMDFFPDLESGEMPPLKGPEIKQWLEEHDTKGCKYVILDDMQDFLPKQQSHLVLIDANVGLTADDAVKAIRLLGKKE